MQIGKHKTDEKVFIVAEIGNNHEGDFGLASEMILLAADAGVDAVKFQSIVPDRLVSHKDKNRINQLARFRLTAEQQLKLSQQAEANGIAFMSTPFDLETVGFLDSIVPAFKIASGDNDFWPLIDCVTQTGKPLIISMGLAQTNDAQSVIDFVEASAGGHGISTPEIALLHCVACYPTPPEQAGISGIAQLARFGVTVGYSDHTMGVRAVELAVAAGARIIEKHFTIDNNHSEFRDHKLSADPEEMKALVKSVREIEVMMGGKDVFVQPCELANEKPMRRSISANRNISAGEIVQEKDLCWLRPRRGLKPGKEDFVCGQKLTKPIAYGEPFTLEHFE